MGAAIARRMDAADRGPDAVLVLSWLATLSMMNPPILRPQTLSLKARTEQGRSQTVTSPAAPTGTACKPITKLRPLPSLRLKLLARCAWMNGSSP